jgi:hypothetical protein
VRRDSYPLLRVGTEALETSKDGGVVNLEYSGYVPVRGLAALLFVQVQPNRHRLYCFGIAAPGGFVEGDSKSVASRLAAEYFKAVIPHVPPC